MQTNNLDQRTGPPTENACSSDSSYLRAQRITKESGDTETGLDAVIAARTPAVKGGETSVENRNQYSREKNPEDKRISLIKAAAGLIQQNRNN